MGEEAAAEGVVILQQVSFATSVSIAPIVIIHVVPPALAANVPLFQPAVLQKDLLSVPAIALLLIISASQPRPDSLFRPPANVPR